jgi:hypothetical protein
MARHGDEGQAFLWNEHALQRRGDHVSVYPARGSHASYEACIEQQRRRAPLGLINDRPECRGSNQFVLEAGQVPLWDLSRARWSCWAGRFGHSRAGISRFEWELYEADGPLSPLWQQRYGGQTSRPCADVQQPADLISEGEEPLDEKTADVISSRGGRLDPLVDACSDWRRPQPQGPIVTACDARGLSRWIRAGMTGDPGAGVQVLAGKERPAAAAWPVAVRRDALARSFNGWRIRAERSARIGVYAACLVGNRPVEAVFEGVRATGGRELRIDDRVNRTWQLLDGAEIVAVATPRLPGEADGPNRPQAQPRDTRCR